ncbi:glycoside hydrolase, subgroup, catalytic core [Cladorrhinum samala]|uniref:chitinase n=1 Tax=Cladorrhinum samala TaxID=585594 RepID=A0AAV9HX61_9PEZI|nr:glycoside hydrolase, subgroup, catalytic core [Cladorrhinum samala]
MFGSRLFALWVPLLGLAAAQALDGPDADGLVREWEEANARTPAKPVLCPVPCSESGTDPARWSVFSDAAHLALCNETLLFSVNVFTEIEDEHTKAGIRACKADLSVPTSAKRDEKTCRHGTQVESKSKAYALSHGQASDASSQRDIEAAGRQVSNYVATLDASCDVPTIAFASSGSAAIGFYAGAQVRQQGVPSKILQKFLAGIAKGPGITASTVIELCDSDAATGSDYVVGIVASTDSDLPFIQKAVKTWANGKCVSEGTGDVKVWDEIELLIPALDATPGGDASITVSRIQARADCTTTTIVSGDWCARVAQRCGISEDQLVSFNSRPLFCNTLMPGEKVCCSPGTLPDLTPKPNPDGSCFTYTTVAGDSCSAIAAAHSLTTARIEELNRNTWGWNGCGRLWVGVNLCLSTGAAPFPAPVANAVCGPTVPGTLKPADSSVNISTLNPCPINACCNVWGQCGITEEYCLVTPADTGAPGSSAPNTNSCISNCGLNIIKGQKPTEAERVSVAYFAAWNHQRPCLNMHVDEIDKTKYTHVHFAFGSVTPTFGINVSAVQDEFDRFKNMTGIKKILSFGGWENSAAAESRAILRDAFRSGNRAIFRQNVVDFVNAHGLDGVDFDWEYPGAADLPGNDGSQGADYRITLLQIKTLLRPTGQTVSFAAPASYYYLKNYPVSAFASFVDYVVYMTYDLHGQWDAGSSGVTTSCPTGRCLRSHVDWPETRLALAMITKAGMPSNKVVVGLASYGRTFKMAQAGCTGPTCQFTGTATQSEAAPGRCTRTRGYLANAEINEIIAAGGKIQQWSTAFENYLVYNDTEWVGYTSESTKGNRGAFIRNSNMLGTADWSVDLQSF